MISRKVEMTLYFTDYDPSLEPMRLVEEADAIKIKPSVELTDSQMMEEMQYD